MPTKLTRRPLLGIAVTAVAVSGLLAACTGSSSKSTNDSSASSATSSASTSSGSGGTTTSTRIVTAETGQAGQFVKNFNPFSPNAQRPTLGMIYEPLMYFNIAKSGPAKPWLAQSYAWSNGGKTITFTMRSSSGGRPSNA